MDFIALGAIVFVNAVFAVANERMTHRGEVCADLMGPSRQKLHFHESQTVFLGNDTVTGEDLFDLAIVKTARLFGVNGDEIFVTVFGQVSAQGGFFFIENAVAGGKIPLVYRAAFDDLVEKA